ncbi:MAG: HIRAN domain-containing protein [Pseudomonadota bacterium]
MKRNKTADCCALILASFIFAASTLAAPTQPRQVLQHGTVMGFQHYEGKELWEQLQVGQPLTLVREVDNQHDNQAIRVEWEGHKLGYVPRADNTDLARLMDNGANVEARITKLQKSRRPNNRVQFEIYMPAR